MNKQAVLNGEEVTKSGEVKRLSGKGNWRDEGGRRRGDRKWKEIYEGCEANAAKAGETACYTFPPPNSR
jgi:hypothetical protein